MKKTTRQRKSSHTKLMTILICCFYVTMILSTFSVDSLSDNRSDTSDTHEHILGSSNPSDWPMFRNNPARTGVTEGQAPNTDVIKQQWILGKIESSPAIINGRIYVASIRSDFSELHCIHINSGQFLWNVTIPGEVISSPACSEDSVYIGTTLGIMYCYDLENGQQQWSYDTGGDIRSSPILHDQYICIGSDQYLIIFNANTGDFITKFTTNGYIRSSPAIMDDIIYFSSLDGFLYAYRLNTYEELWRQDIQQGSKAETISSSPAVYDGCVYVGSIDHHLYCFDASDGTKKWSFDTSDKITASPCVYEGNIYIGSHNELLYCIDSTTGDLHWSFDSDDGRVFSSPVIANDLLYFSTFGGIVYCIDISQEDSYSEIWRYDSNENGFSSPIISDAYLYIGFYRYGEDAGTFYRFGEENIPPTIQFSVEPVITDTYTTVFFNDSSYDPNGYIQNWSWDFGDTKKGYSQQVTHQYTDDGTYTVNLTIKDNEGSMASSEQEVIILNRNPVVVDDEVYTFMNSSIHINVLENDQDIDGMLNVTTLSILFSPIHGGANVNTSTYLVDYQPPLGFIGEDLFTYVVSDDDGASSRGVVRINVSNKWVPIGINDSYNVSEDTTLTIGAPGVLENDIDPDGHPAPLQAIQRSDPYHGTVTLVENGSFIYMPNSNFFGVDSFTYQAFDGMYYSDEMIVSITVQSINDLPVAINDTVTTFKDTSIVINVSENDEDTDGIIDLTSISIIKNPDHGSIITINQDGTIRYCPNASYIGEDLFSYTIEDDDGAVSNTGWVTVQITDEEQIADFSFAPSHPLINQDINFTDLSTTTVGTIVNWSWNFDDGNKSYERHPTHQFSQKEVYQVSLTITNSQGVSDEITKEIILYNDSDRPRITIYSPQDNDDVDQTVYIRGTTQNELFSVTLVEIRIDEGDWRTVSGTSQWEYLWNTMPYENGEHVIEARCFDGQFHSLAQSVTVIISNEGPTTTDERPIITIGSPLEGAKIKGVQWINGTASDDGSIKYVEISIQDQEWVKVSGTYYWSYQWDTTKISDGLYTIKARSYDGSQYSSDMEIHVHVDQEIISQNEKQSSDSMNSDDFSYVVIIMILLLTVIVSLTVILKVIKI